MCFVCSGAVGNFWTGQIGFDSAEPDTLVVNFKFDMKITTYLYKI
jgi:hypothetical protein